MDINAAFFLEAGPVALGAYLLGSIPFGLLLTKFAGLGDIRAIGSGNIGATNVLRTGHKGLAALTLLLDGGKGALAVGLAGLHGEIFALIAAAFAFLGHVFPVWLSFRGGKGVATFLGLVLALHWPSGLLACASWLLIAFVFRFSSLAALCTALLTPLYLVFLGQLNAALLVGALALVLIWRHRANIMRLFEGTEPRIGGT
jgi:glycerol-3-phosphate acyltransferase PlsY